MSIDTKMKLAVLFGGRSAEHEVSIRSARSVIGGLNREKYEIIPIAISRKGVWLSPEDSLKALQCEKVPELECGVWFTPGAGEEALRVRSGEAMQSLHIDMIFPVLHGTFGEDGTIQGLCEMLNIPYVGAGVVGSALGMDKVLAKDVWAFNGIPVTPYVSALRTEWQSDPELVFVRCKEKGLRWPRFVKPANAGSSVGITKAHNFAEFVEAMHVAAQYDRKILIEEAVESPREIEIGVIGNDEPECSVPGQICYDREFYDYEAKYLSGDDPVMHIPADLPKEMTAMIADFAKRAWRALDLNGMGRVDFLLGADGRLWLNEVNTLPGFTVISMFNRLWAGAGVSYSVLLDRLIAYARERYEIRQGLNVMH